jgi:hypothetical protein
MAIFVVMEPISIPTVSMRHPPGFPEATLQLKKIVGNNFDDARYIREAKVSMR